ncbi:hypothetical protein [Longimicrobium sp.]|uniref:hypothetical protein n=1 Tax=Longimicrobium sp. TaxID=2029185 RepID=UPI003B3A1FCB
MTSITLRSVRFAFVTLLLGLTTYTVAESVIGGRHASAQAANEGLSTCGSEEQPCALQPVAVVVEAAPASVSFAANEGLAGCGSEAEPCVLAPIAVEAEREPARLASTGRIARMMVRVGS